MGIKLIKGDIFTSQCDYLVNPVNSIGVMGAGLAKVFREKYPLLCKAYMKKTKAESRQELLPPELYFNICMFPTKIDWRDPSKLDYIDQNLAILKGLLIDERSPSVAFPMLGCGLGGLAKKDVVLLIRRHFLIYGGQVEIYNN